MDSLEISDNSCMKSVDNMNYFNNTLLQYVCQYFSEIYTIFFMVVPHRLQRAEDS